MTVMRVSNKKRLIERISIFLIPTTQCSSWNTWHEIQP